MSRSAASQRRPPALQPSRTRATGWPRRWKRWLLRTRWATQAPAATASCGLRRGAPFGYQISTGRLTSHCVAPSSSSRTRWATQCTACRLRMWVRIRMQCIHTQGSGTTSSSRLESPATRAAAAGWRSATTARSPSAACQSRRMGRGALSRPRVPQRPARACLAALAARVLAKVSCEARTGSPFTDPRRASSSSTKPTTASAPSTSRARRLRSSSASDSTGRATASSRSPEESPATMATKALSAVRSQQWPGPGRRSPLCIILDPSCHRLPQRPTSVDDLLRFTSLDVLSVGKLTACRVRAMADTDNSRLVVFSVTVAQLAAKHTGAHAP